ncbi:hypothetical protein [Streptomyces kronopolitis]|uniref:hypothetical protein n=1 Tax=Streptomyces kronopolitis TaxID=1612435 RepID=UPI003D989207
MVPRCAAGPVPLRRLSSQIAGGTVGGVGLVDIAAAVANGVHHATGTRLRSLPRTLDAPV